MSFFLTPEALADLESVFVYLAGNADVDTAERVTEKILAEIEEVGKSPGIGHQRNDLTDRDVLFRGVYDLLIVYWKDTSPVEVARILHGARDVKRLLDKEL